ncbi:MAG: NADP-dependent oxidoreductase [Patescibacteria group bacterium]
MKAAQISEYGGQEVIKTVDDASKPEFGDDQVLVEVYSAGVNPFDIAVREGFARQMAELSFPAVLGGDLAGVVSEVGSGVTSLKVGDKVYGQAGALSSHGSFAEFAPAKASQLASVPASVDFTTAAALPLVAVSAYQALVDHIGLQAGQKILIHGGSGGIGSIAIQLAKHLGAYVSTTVNGTESDFVKGLGADEVIDYKTQDFSTILEDYDAVLDTVGGETNQKSYLVLKQGGALVSLAAQPDEALIGEHKVIYTYQFTQVNTMRLQKVAELVDNGTLKVNIDKAFSLAEAAEALVYLKTGHPKGKVVIEIKTI